MIREGGGNLLQTTRAVNARLGENNPLAEIERSEAGPSMHQWVMLLCRYFSSLRKVCIYGWGYSGGALAAHLIMVV